MGQRVIEGFGVRSDQPREDFALDLSREIGAVSSRRQEELRKPRKIVLGQVLRGSVTESLRLASIMAGKDRTGQGGIAY